jgi:putative hydrolase of the HAD superfamily
MNSPALICFDVGGTLLHPAEPIGRTYARLAAPYGAVLDPLIVDQKFRHAFRSLKNRPAGTIPRDGDDRPWWREIVRLSLEGQPLPTSFPAERFFLQLYEAYAEPKAWLLYPEVEETLLTLHQHHYRLAVLSNWDQRLHPVLAGHHLTPLFTDLFISAELGLAKPQPALYRHVLKKTNLRAEQILLVGDDPEFDDHLPRTLGWRTFLVQRPTTTLADLIPMLLG